MLGLWKDCPGGRFDESVLLSCARAMPKSVNSSSRLHLSYSMSLMWHKVWTESPYLWRCSQEDMLRICPVNHSQYYQSSTTISGNKSRHDPQPNIWKPIEAYRLPTHLLSLPRGALGLDLGLELGARISVVKATMRYRVYLRLIHRFKLGTSTSLSE